MEIIEKKKLNNVYYVFGWIGKKLLEEMKQEVIKQKRKRLIKSSRPPRTRKVIFNSLGRNNIC